MKNSLGILLVVLVAAACGDAQSAGAEGGGDGPPPTPVEVAIAYADTVVDAILATGQIEAIQAIELRPEVEGRIVSILVREGALVRSGTPLFKVDDAELQAQVARLEAQRDLAYQALSRTQDLIREGAAAQADLEEAEARARSTQADLDLSTVRLERTVVRAPFGGIVGARMVSLGDYVTSSRSLVTLQTINPQRAVFDVPERYAEALAEGQEVEFRVAAFPDRVFTGTVDFVDPVVRLPGRTISVKAVAENPDRSLQSGMFIEARLSTEMRPNAVVIPEDAVLPLQSQVFVWVIADGQATRREVELGVRTPGFVEIKSGVAEGEQVVVGGLERLFEGAPAMPTVVERRPGFESPAVEGGAPGAGAPGEGTPGEGALDGDMAGEETPGEETPQE